MATPEGRELARPASPSQLSPQVEGWLAELDRALSLGSDAYPPEIRQRLIYVLSRQDDSSGPPRLLMR
jgi:hypothetical protein